MNNFKIIEPGRILSPKELAEIEGGVCISGSIYRLCDDEGNRTTCIEFELCVQDFTCSTWFRICTSSDKMTCNGRFSGEGDITPIEP